MSDFTEARRVLEDDITWYHDNERAFNSGRYDINKIKIQCLPEYKNFDYDFISDYNSEFINLYNSLLDRIKNIRYNIERHTKIYKCLDKFYFSYIPKIKELYSQKNYSEAYEVAKAAETSIIDDKDSGMISTARNEIFHTIYEIRFCLIEEKRNDLRFIKSLYKDILVDYKKLNQDRVKEIICSLFVHYFRNLFNTSETSKDKINNIIHAMNESFTLYNTFNFELSYPFNDNNNKISKLIDEEFEKFFNKDVDIDGCLWLHEKVNSCKIRLNISDKILYKSKNELQKEFYRHNASRMDNTTYKNNILNTLNELRQSCILEKSFEKMESAFEIFETIIDPFIGNFTKLNILATYSANKLYVYQYLVVVGKICEVYGYGSPIFDLFNSKITDVYYKKAYLKIIEVSYYCSTILKIDSILPSDPIKEEDKKKVLILAKRFFNNNSVVRNAKNISNKYVVDVAYYLKLNFRTGVTLPPRQQEECFRCAHIHSRLAQKLSYIFGSIFVVLFGIFGLFSLINQTFSTNIFTFGFYQQIPLAALPFVIGAALGLSFLGLSLLFVYQEGYNCGPTATSEQILNIIYCVLGGIGLLASIGIIINKLPAELTWLVKIIGALSLFEISSTIVYSPTKFIYTYNKHKILKIFAICISSLVVLLTILFSVIELVM